MREPILKNIEKGYCYIDGDSLIITSFKCEFKKGVVPEEKIFMKCENCGKLHPIQLGQGDICNDNECECGYDFGGMTTYELFDQTDVYFLYSNPKYFDFGIAPDSDFNSNISFVKKVSNVIGETFFQESWNINDKLLMNAWDYITEYGDEYLLIHKNDTEALLYVYDKVPITNIIILDNDKIYKLKNIKVDINLQYL